jgi:AAA family ATP:ADP antiporter
VLVDPSQPLRARSLAARSVGRLAPAQLESVAADLVRRELRRADAYRLAGAALASSRRGPGMNMLHHLYREIPQAIVDFVLEVHQFLGQLPTAELLAASLRSGNPRERAEALETLEQELPRAVYEGITAQLADAEPSAGSRQPLTPMWWPSPPRRWRVRILWSGRPG